MIRTGFTTFCSNGGWLELSKALRICAPGARSNECSRKGGIRMHWGNWLFKPNNLTLTHSVEGYEIDFEEIHSSAAILDWIFQIHGKPWADARTMYDLVQAFDDILAPQVNYCSDERDI